MKRLRASLIMSALLSFGFLFSFFSSQASSELSDLDHEPNPSITKMLILEDLDNFNSCLHATMVDQSLGGEKCDDYFRDDFTVKLNCFRYKSFLQKYEDVSGNRFPEEFAADFELASDLYSPFRWEAVSFGSFTELLDGFSIPVTGYAVVGAFKPDEPEVFLNEAVPFEAIYTVIVSGTKTTCRLQQLTVGSDNEDVVGKLAYAKVLASEGDELSPLFSSYVESGLFTSKEFDDHLHRLNRFDQRWGHLNKTALSEDLAIGDAVYLIHQKALLTAQLIERLPSYNPSMAPLTKTPFAGVSMAESLVQSFSLGKDYPSYVQRLVGESDDVTFKDGAVFCRLWHYTLLGAENAAYFTRDQAALELPLASDPYMALSRYFFQIQRGEMAEAMASRKAFRTLMDNSSVAELLKSHVANSWFDLGREAKEAFDFDRAWMGYCVALLFSQEKEHLEEIHDTALRSESWPVIRASQEALIIDTPSRAAYWSELGYAAAMTGQDPTRYIERSVELTGEKSAKDFATSAIYLNKSGQPKEAMTELRTGGMTWAENKWIYTGYGQIATNPKKRIKYFDKAAGLSTSDPAKLNFRKGELRYKLLGDTLLNAKKKAKLANQALAYYQKSLSGDRTKPARYRVAQCQTLLGNFRDAMGSLEKLKEDSVGTVNTMFLESVLLFCLNDVSTFSESFDQVSAEMMLYSNSHEGSDEALLIHFFSVIRSLQDVHQLLSDNESRDKELDKKIEDQLSEIEKEIRKLEGGINDDSMVYAKWLRVFKEILLRWKRSAPGDLYYKQYNFGADDMIKTLSSTTFDPYYLRLNDFFESFCALNTSLQNDIYRKLPSKPSGNLSTHLASEFYFGAPYYFD